MTRISRSFKSNIIGGGDDEAGVWFQGNASSPTAWRKKQVAELEMERLTEKEGERGWNHRSSGEPSEELDCTPLAAVIVKAPGLRKRYIAPRTQLRNIILRRRILMSEAAGEKKSIDIKGKPRCELGASACRSGPV